MKNKAFKSRKFRLAPLALCGALLPLGCSNYVDVDLKLIEPCNQGGRALNNVGSLRVSTSGFGTIDTQEFAIGDTPALVFDGESEGAQMTIEGFVGDVNVDGAQVFTGDAQAIGATLPIPVQGEATDLDVTLLMGLADGMGQTTTANAQCSFMDNGADRPGRHGHTATYIPEINKVLIAGGAIWGEGGELLLRSVELYDPATGTYEFAGEMPTTRAYHTATYIGEGRVLLAGGFGVIGAEVTALATTVAYDSTRPTDDPFDRDFPPLVNLRALHTAARIDNKVIFVGGCVGCTPQSIAASSTGDPASLVNSIEIFDIVQKRTFAPQAQLVTPRALHAMTVVSNNRLLVSGGLNASGPVCNVEIFELQGESLLTFDARQGGLAESEFTQCPYGHAQVNIDGARVAFIGGRNNSDGGRVGGPVAQQVIFWNTASGIEPATVNMIAGRYQPNAHTLADGSVVVLGGEIEVEAATAERLYQVGLSYEPRVLAGPPPPQALQKAASVLLPNNQVMNFGGYTREQLTRDVGFVYFGN